MQRLRDETSQTEVAKAMGVHKSTINRLVNEHAQNLFALMAMAGLKAVDIKSEFLTEEELNSLRCLADRGLQTFGTKDNQ